MKRFILLLFTLFLLSGCSEKVQTTQDGLQYIIQKDGVHITGYLGSSSDLVIPSQLDGKAVTAIDANAFTTREFSELTGITLPAGIQTVDPEAFVNCDTLFYILLENPSLKIEQLPANCRTYTIGMQTGDGALQSISCKPFSNTLYGITDKQTAVLLYVDSDTDLLFPETDISVPLTYIAEDALDDAASLRSMQLGTDTLFSPALLDRLMALDSLYYDDDCLTHDWIATLQAAEEINAARSQAGLTPIEADPELIRCARIRVDELSEDPSASSRPDGRRWDTVLEDEGISYYLATAHKATEYAYVIEQEMIPSVIEKHKTQYNEILYDRIGLSYNSDSFYAYATMVSHNTGTTSAGISYEIMDDHIQILDFDPETTHLRIPSYIANKSVTELKPGLLQGNTALQSVYLPGSLTSLETGLLNGCENLRWLEIDSQREWTDSLPEGCVIARVGQDLGYGTLSYLVSYNDVLYAMTNRGCFVLYDVPPDQQEVIIPPTLISKNVSYIYTDALKRSSSLKRLIIPELCGFDLELLTDLEKISIGLYSQNSCINDIYDTQDIVKQINQIRSEQSLPSIRVSGELAVAAATLAAEQEQAIGYTRPNGEKWSSFLNDQKISFHHARAFCAQASSTAEYMDTLNQIVQQFAPANEKDGYVYDQIAVAVYTCEYEGQPTSFIYCIAIQ